MKTFILLILLFYSITCFSQLQKDIYHSANFHLVKQEKYEKWKIIALYSGSVILNGIGDGLNDSHQKTLGHLFDSASIGVIVLSPVVFNYRRDKWYWYVISYTCLRAALFDIAYNLTRNLPVNYTGSTAVTDKFYNFEGDNAMYPRAVFFVVGFAIPLIKL